MNIEDVLVITADEARKRITELGRRVPPADLTMLETLTILQVLESADARLSATKAPVLRLVQ